MVQVSVGNKGIPLWKIIGVLVAFWLLFGGELPIPDIFGPIILPAPFKSDKLNVLIVHETEDVNSYTPGQRDALGSNAASSARKLVEGAGGSYIVLDKDNPPKADATPQWLQEAWQAKQTDLPWIVAASAKGGFTKKLPATAEETVNLLKPLTN